MLLPTTPSRPRRAALAALASLGVLAGAASAQLIRNEPLPENEGVGVVDRRGEAVDPSLTFTDAQGRPFKLEKHLDGERPVLLLLAYYDCPLLCDLMIEQAKTAAAGIRLRAGGDFRVLVISIDHTNTTEQAAEKRERFLAGFDPPLSPAEAERVVFGVSREAKPVRALAKQVGYHYRYLPEIGEYSHPPAIMFLKPDGTVHTTLRGVGIDPKQVMLALTDAADGKPATIFEKMIFSCYAYDPTRGTFTADAMNIMRLGAGGAAVALGLVIGGLFIHAHLKGRSAGPGGDAAARTAYDSTGKNPA